MDPQTELDSLYIKIGTEGYGEPTDEDMKRIEALEGELNPPAPEFEYKCPNCGSKWCNDPASWDCIAASEGDPMGV